MTCHGCQENGERCQHCGRVTDGKDHRTPHDYPWQPDRED